MVDNARPVNESFAVAGQVSPEKLQQAAQEGFKSVLNVRSAHEPGFAEDEPQQAEKLGLAYARVPLQVDNVTIDQLTHILAELDQLPSDEITLLSQLSDRQHPFHPRFAMSRNGAT